MRTMREFLNVRSSMSVGDLCAGMVQRTERTFYFYFLIPSLVILAVSLFLDLVIFTENLEFYFQRASALVVALFVAIEFRLYRHIARYERVVSTSEYVLNNDVKPADDSINECCVKLTDGSINEGCVKSTDDSINEDCVKFTDDSINEYCEKYLSDSKVFRYFLSAGGIVGTLIWGYGDLLFKMIG